MSSNLHLKRLFDGVEGSQGQPKSKSRSSRQGQGANDLTAHLLPNHILHLLSSGFKSHPRPSSHPPYSTAPGKCIQIVRPLAKSKLACYEGVVGKMVLKSGKNKLWEFERDRGERPVAVKTIMWKSPNPAIEDYLDIEYQTNLECHEGNPLACEIIVPTHCYAKAGSQSNDGAEKGLRWDDEGFLRVLISPLHTPFTLALRLDNPLHLSDIEIRQLWQSGYQKLLRLHQENGIAHRDVKAANAVINSNYDAESGELKLVRPLELLWIDLAEADYIKITPRRNTIAGTAALASQSVVNTWYSSWIEEVAKKNPLFMRQPNADPKTAPPPHWMPENVTKLIGYVDFCKASHVQGENDAWAWGMSLLSWRDREYVRNTAFNEARWDRFRSSLPASGPPKSYLEVVDEVHGLQDVYVPIYEQETYRLQKDEEGNQISAGNVEEEWWDLLSSMLFRPALRHQYCYTIGSDNQRQTQIQDSFAKLTAPKSADIPIVEEAVSAEEAPGIGMEPKSSEAVERSESEVATGRRGLTRTEYHFERGALVGDVMTFRETAMPKSHPDLDDPRVTVEYRRMLVCGCETCTQSNDKSQAQYRTFEGMCEHLNPACKRKVCKALLETGVLHRITAQYYGITGDLDRVWTNGRAK